MLNVFELVSLKLFVMFLVAYSGGLLVRKMDVRVNYTRKINHFFLFYVPSFADSLLLEDDVGNFIKFLNEGLFVLATIIVFIKPMRKNNLIAIAFSSFDRPEDRPYTLLWYVSQAVAGYLVLVPLIHIYESYHIFNLLDITILISVIGDGLAEPIGVRFGRHKYAAYSIFTSRKYVRSLEGSAAVFIVSIIVVCMFKPAFNETQFIAALVSMPVLMTFSEAVSPHTWDGPFMIMAGALLIFAIKVFL